MLAEDTFDNTHGVQNAVSKVLKKAEKSPGATATVTRLYKDFSRALLDILPELSNQKEINAAVGSEAIALFAQLALEHDPISSKRAKLQLKGLLSFRKQIENAGGVYSTQEVANLLNISQSAVRKRLERGRLFAIPYGENTSYPVWQFDEGGVLEHFLEIRDMLGTSSPVGAVQFFLNYEEDLEERPIDVLQRHDESKLNTVITLAKQFNQQVAR